jgi:hypothetical protein
MFTDPSRDVGGGERRKRLLEAGGMDNPIFRTQQEQIDYLIGQRETAGERANLMAKQNREQQEARAMQMQAGGDPRAAQLMALGTQQAKTAYGMQEATDRERFKQDELERLNQLIMSGAGHLGQQRGVHQRGMYGAEMGSAQYEGNMPTIGDQIASAAGAGAAAYGMMQGPGDRGGGRRGSDLTGTGSGRPPGGGPDWGTDQDWEDYERRNT